MNKKGTIRFAPPSTARPARSGSTVTDTGPGIPVEDTDKLFLPHFSTKKKGTGLGLAIVSQIIKEHNGAVRVENNRPIGAQFTIELPA